MEVIVGLKLTRRRGGGMFARLPGSELTAHACGQLDTLYSTASSSLRRFSRDIWLYIWPHGIRSNKIGVKTAWSLVIGAGRFCSDIV